MCPQGDEDSGTNDGGLPVAVKCTDVDADSKCNGWRVRGFRACVYDFDTAKGGNWRWGGDGCPVNTEIVFTVP